MGNFIRSIVEGLGSKRLTAALVAGLTAIVAALLTLVAATALKRFGFELTTAQIGTITQWVVGLAVTPLVAYILSQWHVDVASKGATTTAWLLANKFAKAVDGAIPDGATGLGAVVDQVAKVVEVATEPEGVVVATINAQAAAVSPVAGAAVLVPPAPIATPNP